jgi:hypothetical protein
MAKVDDYQQSFDLAAAELIKRNFNDVASRAGAQAAGDGSFLELGYYGRPVKVETNPMNVYATDDGPEVPLAEQALILHYLTNADGSEPGGDWITFREVPSGEFYWSAFVRRAKNPLVGFFGERPELLTELGPLVGGEAKPEMSGDTVVLVKAFPRVPILLQLWRGDDEFPADGNLLFDKTISNYLSTEDVALAAGLPIYKMMALARSR